jgi:hypothetical protein
LQDFGDCIQSSQIGPHLVQPLRARPKATTPISNIKRLNMVELFPTPYHKASSQAFSSRAASGLFRQMHSKMREYTGWHQKQARNRRSCKTSQKRISTSRKPGAY